MLPLTSRLTWRKEIKEVFLIFLLGCLMTFAFNWNLLNKSNTVIGIAMSYSGLMWVFFWKGNQYLVEFWNRRISWLKNPGKRFIVGLITVVIYTPLILWILSEVYRLLLNINIDMGTYDVIVSLVVTFLITFFLFAKEFLSNWRRASLDAERAKREQMASKYESLKNQVNPHFLFNSLNALTNLVYEDQDLAADFIRQLSKVYRYVLDTKAQEVVSVKQELEFVDSYVFLQKIRFDDKLRININVEGHQQSMVPPIAIQMLLENAIKHNTIAEEEPLTIDISVEEDKYLIIRNNLQKKTIPLERSSGMGLANITARYEFLSQVPVVIQETEKEFIVKLPLLEIKS